MFALFLVVPVTDAEASTTHTVQRGESLWLIGNKYGVTVAQLQQTNGISGTTIYVGQRLVIPGGASTNSGVHTVVRGDTLFLIGQRYGVSHQEIMRLNNLSSATIYPGQTLRIPAAAGTTVSRSTVRPNASNISAADLDLLARIISAEAQGEPYLAQVAVGAVVLNRVAHKDFPNTIHRVVYERTNGIYQFSPVQNGWINKPATESSRRAAVDALNGWDPTNGAIYFFESWVTNKFLVSRPVATRIGAFTFAY